MNGNYSVLFVTHDLSKFSYTSAAEIRASSRQWAKIFKMAGMRQFFRFNGLSLISSIFKETAKVKTK